MHIAAVLVNLIKIDLVTTNGANSIITIAMRNANQAPTTIAGLCKVSYESVRFFICIPASRQPI